MIRGVLFDLDGTLYRQSPLRLLMAAELATVPCLQSRPWRAPRVWKTLREFRRVREELRGLGCPNQPLERLQYTATAERLRVPVGDVEAVVRNWILQRPLKYLRHVARPGLRKVFEQLQAEHIRVGVFSDYPVRDKLTALGLADLVSLMLEATADDVNAFKPHPRGFERACEQWALQPRDVLYVGDRPEVDAVGAAAARMPCAIIGAHVASASPERFVAIREIPAILRVIGVEQAHEERSA